MNIFRAFTLMLLITSSSLANSGTLYIQGTVKPIVTFTITKVSDKVYNATVLSNNPNGFQLTVTTDTETKVLSTPSQTETKTFNYILNFTNVPQYVTVSVTGD